MRRIASGQGEGRSFRASAHEMVMREHPGEMLAPDMPKFHPMNQQPGDPQNLPHPVVKMLGGALTDLVGNLQTFLDASMARFLQ